MSLCRRFFISGKVQGVFYRDSTRKEAIALGIKGWVRNLMDGRVEVLACGLEQDLDNLEKWLWEGPSNARVESVTESPISQEEEYTSFDIRKDG